jgi:hypothetical protein
MQATNVHDSRTATRINASPADTFKVSAIQKVRFSTFLAGFRRLRHASKAALGGADAESVWRSITMVQVHLDELRCMYDLLPAYLQACAWMLISVERGA